MGAVKANLGKDTIKSDLYRQKSDATISKANAKAGLTGVDTTAGKLQEDRNAAVQAKAVNEDFQQKALGQYGQAVSGIQNAAANLWLGTMGMALGSQENPQMMQEKGILSELLT
jgi:PAB1-binding protein PBP1